MLDASLIIALLDQLERQEAALLAWGVVDGGFSDDELLENIRQVLRERGSAPVEAWNVIDEMASRGLLFRMEDPRGNLWRTRSAETVRLLARLRQLFPRNHDPAGAWHGAPTLVADFRYILRPRTYPQRHIQPEQALASVPVERLLGMRRAALSALLNDGTRRLVLADFQVRATQQVLADLDGSRSRGVIVGAGTGSGKTLAFYLPALSYIAERIDSQHWTKALAIYPRKELLRDQFSETYREARRLDGILTGEKRRKLRIGALYGDTPTNAAKIAESWEKGTYGHICPYLSCPACGRDMEWRLDEARARKPRLRCVGCTYVISDDEVLVTRDQMMSTPPDILFTTTEMLNQRMADGRLGIVFGIGAARPPHLVLLDEVHTYEGTSGAQVGMLLRRWQHRIGTKVEFVGLSATLREALTFFAQLTGLPPDRITHVQPEAREMVSEGAEYLLALRADPVTGKNVLSTTIQTAMLLARCLDPASYHGNGPSEGVYGRRAFVFTDALDVTNRLYFNLSDAEGLDSWGKAEKEALAVLREPTAEVGPARRRAGQSWELPVSIGHSLQPGSRLRVGRTSSQDVGVDRRADLVVATAALEVGFNDPRVGAVIQHKAPRAVASFLQRKGRAGRSRQMRPWTVVVLSDYGFDRDAYQSYDLLFDPELEPRYLPVGNRYVLRMHAVQAFFDWAATKLSRTKAGSLWHDLSGPPDETKPWAPAQKARQAVVASLIQDILAGGPSRAELTTYVGRALRVDAATLDEILWLPPRSLFFGALPTLLRRLRTGWQVAEEDRIVPGADTSAPRAPLPDYVPAQLFSPLSLPEVRVSVPAQTRNEGATDEAMPLIQALREFAPGRISRRYGINNVYNRHWLAPGEVRQLAIQVQDVDSAYEYEELGSFACVEQGAVVETPVIRPHRIRTVKAPKRYRDSTNSFLQWRTQLIPDGHPVPVDLPDGAAWSSLFVGIEAFLHAGHSHILARRFAPAAEASVSLESGENFSSEIRFAQRGQSVAIGGVFDVDGLRIRLRIPPLEWLLHEPRVAPTRRAFRSAYFRHLIEIDPVLSEHANRFQRPWLHDLLLAALVTEAVARGADHPVPLVDALEVVSAAGLGARMMDVLGILIQRATFTDPADDSDTGQSAGERPALWQRMQAICTQPAVIRRLQELAPVLWEDPRPEWLEWARDRFVASVGNAVLLTCQRLCPEFDPGELLLDLDGGPEGSDLPRRDQIWITETTIGGAGFVETLTRRVMNDPRRFLRLIEAAFRPTDAEVVDTQLQRFLDLAGTEPSLGEAVAQYRGATRHAELGSAFDRLRAALRHAGFMITHPVLAGLASRILRPGSSPNTDVVAQALITRWRAIEDTLGIEVDSRVFAYHASASEELDNALHTIVAPSLGDRREWRFDTISSLLWTRGWQAKASGLESYNPFTDHPPSDRELVVYSVQDHLERVDIGSDEWMQRLHAALRLAGSVWIRTAHNQESELVRAIIQLMVDPVDIGFMYLYPALTEVTRTDVWLDARLELREVLP